MIFLSDLNVRQVRTTESTVGFYIVFWWQNAKHFWQELFLGKNTNFVSWIFPTKSHKKLEFFGTVFQNYSQKENICLTYLIFVFTKLLFLRKKLIIPYISDFLKKTNELQQNYSTSWLEFDGDTVVALKWSGICARILYAYIGYI